MLIVWAVHVAILLIDVIWPQTVTAQEGAALSLNNVGSYFPLLIGLDPAGDRFDLKMPYLTTEIYLNG